MAEKITWRGVRYRLIRRGSRRYSPGDVTLKYNPSMTEAEMAMYREKGNGFWATTGAVGELGGENVVLDGNHRFKAGLTMTCERYVGEVI